MFDFYVARAKKMNPLNPHFCSSCVRQSSYVSGAQTAGLLRYSLGFLEEDPSAGQGMGREQAACAGVIQRWFPAMFTGQTW